MIVRTSMVLVVTGTLFALVGVFAPAANIGAAFTPTSLYQIVGGLLGREVGAPAIPAGLLAIEMRLLGGAGVLLVCAFLAIALAVFKLLRSALVPCLLMTAAAGYLMFTMTGVRDVVVAVPQSYGWILLIAGSLVASVTAFFTLFGTGPDERRKSMTAASEKKKKGRLPFEVETTSVREPPPPPPKPVEAPKPPEPKAAPAKAEAPPQPGGPKIPPPRRDEPRPQRLSQALRAEKPKAEAPKAEAPKPEAPTPGAAKPDAPKPEAPEPEAAKPAAPPGSPVAPGGAAAKAGAAGRAPGTLSPMPESGYSGEEPTESGGWVLSGFDANGMAVRLNISDVDLRTAEEGIVIGRNAKQCRLVLNDDSVSRRHARLAGSNPLTIEDLDSANGTVVNRQILAPGEKMPIEPGVAIEIGAVRLTLVRS